MGKKKEAKLEKRIQALEEKIETLSLIKYPYLYNQGHRCRAYGCECYGWSLKGQQHQPNTSTPGILDCATQSSTIPPKVATTPNPGLSSNQNLIASIANSSTKVNW
jgi:hypothetical protein